MQHIKAVFESLCRALIRFFDNRFIKSNDVEWYRMELVKRSEETQKLIQSIIAPKVLIAQPESDNDMVPIQPRRFKSFAQKRKELEQESYLKAQKLIAEAKVAMASKKTTAELEADLLNGTE